MATEEEKPGAAKDENVGRKVAQAVEKQIDAGLPWLQKRTGLGNFAQLGSLLVAVGALVMSGIALRVGCANESNSKLNASTAVMGRPR